MYTESGRTMMEMLGVLAIMGLLTYAAIRGINSGMTSFKINQAYSDVSETVTKIQDLFFNVFGKGDYPQFDTTDPESELGRKTIKTFEDNGISLKGRFGTNMVVIVTDGGGNFQITYTTLNNDDDVTCNKLKAMDWARLSISAGECSDGKLVLTPKL